MTTSLLRRTLATVLLAAPLLVGPAHAIVAFPGCGATLQACIDQVAPSETIRIATNGPIDEHLQIAKSLALVAAPGFQPIMAPFSTVTVSSTGSADLLVIVRGLTWAPAGTGTRMRLVHGSTGSFQAFVLNNAFRGITGSTSGTLLEVAGPLDPAGGPMTVTIGGNHFEVPAVEVSPMSVSLVRGSTLLQIAGNVIDTADVNQDGAIRIVGGTGAANVDVLGNVVRSANSEESAIELWQNGAGGTLTARVAQNLVRGTGEGMRFGLDAYASAGSIALTAVHNTIVGARLRAVQIGGVEGPGAMTGVVANNVLAHSGDSDFGIHEFRGDVVERNNLLTVIDPDDAPESPGPHSILVADPLLAPDDRLLPTSPAVNAADPAYVPADLDFDLDGLPRVAGPAADLGAFELPCDPDDPAPHCSALCTPATCRSDDPCAPASCVGQSCVVTPATGLDAARCVCDRPLPEACTGATVPTAVRRRAEKACLLLDQIATMPSGKRVTRKIGTARRHWTRAAERVTNPRLRSDLTPACVAALGERYTDAAARTGALLGPL